MTEGLSELGWITPNLLLNPWPSRVRYALLWDKPGAPRLVGPIPGARSATIDIRVRSLSLGPFLLFQPSRAPEASQLSSCQAHRWR